MRILTILFFLSFILYGCNEIPKKKNIILSEKIISKNVPKKNADLNSSKIPLKYLQNVPKASPKLPGRYGRYQKKRRITKNYVFFSIPYCM